MSKMRFIPKNPQKYMGDPLRIVARSSWELIYMHALDGSNMVARWLSEPKTLNIKYFSPIDKKVHVYWPDFLVQYVDNSVEILEIKPLKESSLNNARSTYDKLMLVKNMAKWTAAEKFAKSIGARFRVVTEIQQQAFKKKPRQPSSARKTTGTRR